MSSLRPEGDLPGKPQSAKHLIAPPRLSLPLHNLDRRNQVPKEIIAYGVHELQTILANPNASEEVLIIDVRTYAHFAAARLRDAISVSILSTLLKRPSFGLKRLIEFLSPDIPARINDTSQFRDIIIYDASTESLETSGIIPLFSTVCKFHEYLEEQGTLGQCKLGYLRGGFDAAQKFEASKSFIDSTSIENGPDGKQGVRRSPLNLLPVCTGVSLSNSWGPGAPASSGSTSFDDSSRIDVCADMYKKIDQFPLWLQRAVKESRSGHNVLAENFQRLQISEQARIQQALSASAPRSARSSAVGSAGALSPPQLASLSSMSSAVDAPSPITPLASSTPKLLSRIFDEDSDIEYTFSTGDDVTKNRYSNIAPYTHRRVLLNGVGDQQDYINASYIETSRSHLRYIATQAPLPNSLSDFWKVIWDHKVPIIVMLTSLASESGQVKGHIYWEPGTYGDVTIEKHEEQISSQLESVLLRRITLSKADTDTGKIIRREVVQLYYDIWPDLGRPEDTEDMLSLLSIKAQLLEDALGNSDCSDLVVVHCSAGCGRTGTFCTVDSVIDGLKSTPHTKMVAQDVDLINQTVKELRSQRLAMVNVQRQFQYCYDVVLLWYYRAFLSTADEQKRDLPTHLTPVGIADPAESAV